MRYVRHSFQRPLSPTARKQVLVSEMNEITYNNRGDIRLENCVQFRAFAPAKPTHYHLQIACGVFGSGI